MKNNLSKAVYNSTGLIIIALCLSIPVFVICDNFFQRALDGILKSSDFIKSSETDYVFEMQKFIDEKQLGILDCKELEQWVTTDYGEDILYLVISKDEDLIYGISHQDGYLLAGDIIDDVGRWSHYFLPVEFVDASVEIAIYTKTINKLYYFIDALSGVMAVSLCLFIAFKCINFQLKKLQRQLNEAEAEKESIIQSKYELISELTHDLRTPLTGLMTYAEIVKNDTLEGKDLRLEYIEKILNKANDIKVLTDDLFEFSSKGSIPNTSANTSQTFQEAFQDYLSTEYEIMQNQGFLMQTYEIEFPELFVKVNDYLLARIFNNISSNICRYGLKGGKVWLTCWKDDNFVYVELRNEIADKPYMGEEKGQGLKNIDLMMQAMNGEFIYKVEKNCFISRLKFKIVAMN